jgi:multiple sugar transport system substrate-binding protein
MQQSVCSNPHSRPHFPRPPRPSLLAGLLGLAMLTGCAGDADKTAAPTGRFAGATLTIACGDSEFAEAITPAVRSWAERTGATVTIRTGAMTAADDSDIGIIPASDLGYWAELGELVPVPPHLRAADHPFQWTGLLPAYRELLIEWGGQARALPLAGDGFVVVYRADRLADPKFVEAFRARFGRPPAAPATWEEFADLAVGFAAFDGKPSLPPLSGPELTDLFFRVAACMDRRALEDAAVARGGGGVGSLAFQFDLTTGEPRLTAPGFRAAADWLGSLADGKSFAPAPPAGTAAESAAALGDGRAALAVLSLAQLAHLPRENGEVPARFGLMPLPGSRRYFDHQKGELVTTSTPNYIPYFAGGRLGVVRTRCPHPEAAFDLLAELGGPARSLELVGNPALGAGPFRTAHLDRDQHLIWLGYGLDEERSRALRDAMQQYVRQEVKNPVAGLHGPDQGPLTAAAAEVLPRIAAGNPPAATLEELQASWQRIDEQTPKDERLRWRKFAAGLN